MNYRHRIELTTEIKAPIERCYDLSRSIDLHRDSLENTDEEAIAGVTTGLIGIGQTVTWKARHFGRFWKLTSKMIVVDQPRVFEDQQLKGPFKGFRHRHDFEEIEGGTRIHDVFEYTNPAGPLGWLIGKLVMDRHLRNLLETRNRYLKAAAETEGWKRYLSDG